MLIQLNRYPTCLKTILNNLSGSIAQVNKKYYGFRHRVNAQVEEFSFFYKGRVITLNKNSTIYIDKHSGVIYPMIDIGGRLTVDHLSIIKGNASKILNKMIAEEYGYSEHYSIEERFI